MESNYTIVSNLNPETVSSKYYAMCSINIEYTSGALCKPYVHVSSVRHSCNLRFYVTYVLCVTYDVQLFTQLIDMCM
jgi:hypothetical protein